MLGNNSNAVGAEYIMSKVIYSAMQPNFVRNETGDIKISTIKTSDKSAYSNNVYFRDPLSNAYIQTGLSDENLDRLQNVFGKDSIKKDGEGNVLLKGEAERFVSGWFGDIAYKRGYIKADANQDGNLSDNEKQQLTAGYYGLASISQGNMIKPEEIVTYVRVDESCVHASQLANSIEEALNDTLQNDKNSDGMVTINEKHTLEYIKKILSDLTIGSGYVPPSINEVFGFLEEMDENLKEMLKKELEKVGIETKEIRADMSAKEILKKLMENEEGTKGFLEKFKESLENQESPKEDSIFQQIQDLTKLDKDTLEKNLANNSTFEEDIISIVGELVENVDAKYSKSTLATRALDIGV